MADETFSITLPDGKNVTALRTRVRKAKALVAYAPGAGANIYDPFGRYLAPRLAEHDISTVRLQFPYAEARKPRPDPPAVLQATWRAAIDVLRGEAPRLIVGGRSMGGRIASMVVAQGVEVDGVALFAYPLHPIGKPDVLRTEHLPDIAVPVLFVSGMRDAFGTPDELRRAASLCPNARLQLLEGTDHGFNVPKASGRTRDDVWSEATAALLEWMGKDVR